VSPAAGKKAESPAPTEQQAKGSVDPGAKAPTETPANASEATLKPPNAKEPTETEIQRWEGEGGALAPERPAAPAEGAAHGQGAGEPEEAELVGAGAKTGGGKAAVDEGAGSTAPPRKTPGIEQPSGVAGAAKGAGETAPDTPGSFHRVVEQGKPQFQLKKGEAGLSVFAGDKLDPGEITPHFREGSQIKTTDLQRLKDLGTGKRDRCAFLARVPLLGQENGTGANGIKISRKSAPQLHLLHLRKMWPPVRMVVAEATNQQEATDG